MTLTSSSQPWVLEPACPLMDASHTSSFSTSTPPAPSAPASKVNKQKQLKNYFFMFLLPGTSIVNPVLEGQIKKTFFVPTTSVVGESKPGKATMIPKKEKLRSVTVIFGWAGCFFWRIPSLNSKATCVAMFIIDVKFLLESKFFQILVIKIWMWIRI